MAGTFVLVLLLVLLFRRCTMPPPPPRELGMTGKVGAQDPTLVLRTSSAPLPLAAT